MTALLQVRDLGVRFGGLAALQSVSFSAGAGEITAVIGPNGAGKTTAVNCISGMLKPDAGQVLLDGNNITGLPAHRFPRLGMTRTYQNLRIFGRMTVLENVMVGLHGVTTREFVSVMFRLPGVRSQEQRMKGRALETLKLFGLVEHRFKPAGQLPYGDQKKLELARGVASDPKLILLDEPVAGLNAAETETIGETISAIKNRGTGVVLIEHDMSLVMRISDHVVVLSGGQKISEGPPDKVQCNEDVIRTYLGGGEEFGLHA